MMTLEQTQDYEVFQHFEWNRGYHEGNIKKIMKSISEHNMLKSRPILVDESFRVLDGKHRLEAARRLQVPVWYQVHENLEETDIIKLNNAVKSWSIRDYLNFYSKKDYKDYVELEKFMNTNSVQIEIAISLLNSNRSEGFFRDFKDGLYKFPNAERYLQAISKKNMVDETIEFIKKTTSGHKSYLGRVTFYNALVEFFNNEGFCYDTFNKKLQYKIDFMHPCSKKEDYIKVFKNIYNWSNRTPIE